MNPLKHCGSCLKSDARLISRLTRPPSARCRPPAESGLSQFELLAELGRGGMGVVYKARHRQLNRLVALKMIRDGKHARPEHRERFRIEAEAVARLRHPNIVQIYEIGEADGRPFVSLELLEGGSLADRLKGTTQPGRAAAELVATLARAMHAAHRAGIVHRDLKPANVLFDRDGIPKITDFGLAKRLEVEEGQTQTGQVMGTPSYMAPEQAQGRVRQIGPPADIYALGAILYEMLTGRPPFKGPSTMETLHQVVYDDVVPPSRLQPRIARDLETICLKCLAEGAAEALRHRRGAGRRPPPVPRRRPIRARRTPLWERGAKWARRHPATATLIGLGAAAVVMLVVAGRALRRPAQGRGRRARPRVAAACRSEQDLVKAQDRRWRRSDWTDGRLILSNLLDRPEAGAPARPTSAAGPPACSRRPSGTRGRGRPEPGPRAAPSRSSELRNEAFFHETRFTGLDLPTDLQATRAAARAALARLRRRRPGRCLDAVGRCPRTLSPQERAEIVEGCYELLLVLAEAVAQALPGEDPVVQAERGLRILDQAARLRPEPDADLPPATRRLPRPQGRRGRRGARARRGRAPPPDDGARPLPGRAGGVPARRLDSGASRTSTPSCGCSPITSGRSACRRSASIADQAARARRSSA